MTPTKVAYLSKLYYHTKFYNPTLSDTSVAPTPEVYTTIMLFWKY